METCLILDTCKGYKVRKGFPVRREWKQCTHLFISQHNLSERAFPFEGNGNYMMYAPSAKLVIFEYTFPFKGNGNIDSTIPKRFAFYQLWRHFPVRREWKHEPRVYIELLHFPLWRHFPVAREIQSPVPEPLHQAMRPKGLSRSKGIETQ